jgi:hypothetical protein
MATGEAGMSREDAGMSLEEALKLAVNNEALMSREKAEALKLAVKNVLGRRLFHIPSYKISSDNFSDSVQPFR